MTVVQTDSSSVTFLVGHVQMHNHEGVFSCDSALWWRASERFDAFGDVRFRGKNGVRASSKQMRYEQGLLKLSDQVELRHGSQIMTGPRLNYHTANEEATFTGRSLIRQGRDSLYANRGQYDASQQIFRYQGDIKVLTEDFDVACEQLNHWSEEEIMRIPVSGRAVRDSGFIQFGSAYMHDVEDLAIFRNGVYGQDGQDWFQSERMWHDQRLDQIAMSGESRWRQHGADGLEVRGDSLNLAESTTQGFGDIHLFVQNVSARSEALHWDDAQDVLTLTGNPELWTEGYFIRCTTLKLFRMANDRDSIALTGPVLVLERTEDSLYYHQMTGKSMTGWLNDMGPENLLLKGNATALYHAGSDRVNVTQCAQILLVFNEDEGTMVLDTMTFMQSPDGTVDGDPSQTLDGFVDHFDDRPSRIDWISGLK